MSAAEFLDPPVSVRVKLSALWASTMFLYLYGDYFGLYKPGTLQSMLDGLMGPLGPTTQGILVGTALMMAIPSVMVILALVLPVRVNRVANIALGLLYTAIILATMPGAWHFYLMLGVVEAALTLAVAWTAWKWPRA